MRDTTRRDFLQRSAAATIGLAGLGAMHPREVLAQLAPEDAAQPPTLVTLYLRGGSDPLQTIIPHGDRLYYEYRPTLAVPQPDSADPDQNGQSRVIPINRYFGFHPAMRPLYDLYTQGLMTPIVNTGSTHPTRSHFDAQDFMERAAPGIKSITEGWLNRYLTATRQPAEPDLRAVSLQATLPRSLRGSYPVLAVPDYGAEEAMDVFEELYDCEDCRHTDEAAGLTETSPEDDNHAAPVSAEDESRHRILRAGQHGIARLRYLNEALATGPRTRRGVRYPRNRLGQQLRDTAKLIKANVGLEVTAIDYNGWDHHAYQGRVFERMMSTTSQALHAFLRDLDARMGKVLVLVMTEFGRTARENGNNGTDHGHGGYMFAVGGGIKPSPHESGVYGRWTGLQHRALYEGRDLPVHTDFRDVFAEVLSKVFHFDTQAHDFFPQYAANDRALNFLNSLYEDVADG